MRALLILIGVAALALVAAMSLGLVHVSQTRDAKLPAVALEGGQSPKFQADVANIQFTTENKSIAVPTIDMKETTVKVPTLKVDRDDRTPIDGNMTTSTTTTERKSN